MTLSTWTPPLTKLHVYEAVYSLNRALAAAIAAVDRLERLEFFASDSLGPLKIRLDHLRAEANSELIENLQEFEQEEAGRLDRERRELDRQLEDPDDVFFKARNRKQEIREQMRELQRGLDRQRPGSRSRKPKKKRLRKPN